MCTLRKDIQADACQVKPCSLARLVRRHLLALNFAALLLTAHTAAFSQEASEYQLKAAFLFNFAKFTEWPNRVFKADNAPLVLGILGTDPFGEAVNFIRGKKVKNRELVVQNYKEPSEIENCQILFIGSSEDERLSEIFRTVNASTVLTVGETDSLIAKGGAIKFVAISDRLGFEINARAVRKAEYKVSSQLLKFGRLVEN